MFDLEVLNGLERLAVRARDLAYAPYSGYKVGASLLTINDEMFGGVGNVESSNFSLTKHGEETAVLAALASGALERLGQHFICAVFLAPAYKDGAPQRCLPCGGCRQFVREFANPNGAWLIKELDGSISKFSFEELLPFPK